MTFFDKFVYAYKLKNEFAKSEKEIFKILNIEDIEIPKIILIKNFPDNLASSLKSRTEFINSCQEIVNRFPHDVFKRMLVYLKLSLPAFENKKLLEHWKKLNKLSSSQTEEFIKQLTWNISHDYDWIVSLANKHTKEIHHGKYIQKHCAELVNLIENYQNLYFGHFITDEFNKFYKSLTKFIPDLESSIKDFETDRIGSYKSTLWPINREYRSQNAKSLFFARKIYFFFKKNFKKPLHNINADFVNTIFETNYTENDIIKMVKDFKKYEIEEELEKRELEEKLRKYED